MDYFALPGRRSGNLNFPAHFLNDNEKNLATSQKTFGQRGVHKLGLQDLAFFDHLPASVYIFYGINVYKKSIFLTTYPPPLVNVVCERPLMQNANFGYVTR